MNLSNKILKEMMNEIVKKMTIVMMRFMIQFIYSVNKFLNFHFYSSLNLATKSTSSKLSSLSATKSVPKSLPSMIL